MVQEIANSMFTYWNPRLSSISSVDGDKVLVVRLTGDTMNDLKLLESGTLVICTSLQWDALSRRWKQRKQVQNIALYVVDELHMLGATEGQSLEIVVSRARYVASQLDKRVRIVGLSHSLANAKDVGEWLGATPGCVYNFAPDVRPVPLEVHIHGFDISHFGSRLLAMAKPVYNAIVGHSPTKPVIVFVPSRKQAQLTAIDLITFAVGSGDANKFLRIDSSKIQELTHDIREVALVQTLLQGVGFIHEGLTRGDRQRVEDLFRGGIIGVLVCPRGFCWSLSIPAHLVVVMETVYYEGKEHRFVDYNIADIIQMLGRACRPLLDDIGKCVVLCYTPKKEYLKKLLNDPLPIESHLDQFLHDHINAEVVTKTIENKQDAVDYLTWTYFYRRLAQNPNYYGLQGVSHRHLSDHLSEVVESVVGDLEESKCVVVDDDVDLAPLNLGMIASYYYIQYTTVELFASSLTAKSKTKGLLEILSASSEYSSLSMRQGEDEQLSKLAMHLPQQMPSDANYDDPCTKALILLQAHFSRQYLPTDLSADLMTVLQPSMKLIQALVDVISSQGWLKPALAAMEISQMTVQGVWAKDSVAILLQVPHFTTEIIERCKVAEPPVESVFDILELDDDQRNNILQLSPEKMSDVALFCNAYPNIELTYEMNSEHEVWTIK